MTEADFLHRCRVRYWRRLLRQYGSVRAAANYAGISRASAYRIIKEIGLSPAECPSSRYANRGNQLWQSLR